MSTPKRLKRSVRCFRNLTCDELLREIEATRRLGRKQTLQDKLWLVCLEIELALREAFMEE